LGEFFITLVVAMLPVLELRGAIPLGVSMGLHPWIALIAGVIGNVLPAPFIIIFIRRIFAWLRRRSSRLEHFITRMESRAEGKWDKVHKFEFLGLLVLVAIPIPGTGAWTGSLVAALANMRLRNSLPAIIIGVIVAGFMITGLTVGFTAVFS
jgi:uncharacterized membrane protein